MDLKITFPRLRSHSEYPPKSKTLNTITSDRLPQTSLTLRDKLNNIKYKYVNKSPTYFKHKNLSPTVHMADYPSKSIEKYVLEQNKILDKNMLLQLTKSRTKKLRTQQYNQHKRQEQCRQSSREFQETKYSNFRPLKFPIKHALRSIKHPDLTLEVKPH